MPINASNEFEFTLSTKVHDPHQLRAAALAHPDTQEDQTFLDSEGHVDIGACLVMLLDPGTLPGCSINDSDAERIRI